MFVYHYFSMICNEWKTISSAQIFTDFPYQPSESRWMVPGTFDCDGNSTL